MEPAIKPATQRTRSGVVGVIATEATFQGDLFASLIARYAGDVHVIPQVCPGLVGAVEAGALENEETDGLLRACLEPLLHAGMDHLVLGCTHYPFLTPAIERIVGPGVSVIDPAPAVARQTARVLGCTPAVGDWSEAGDVEPAFLTTGDPASFKNVAARLLDVPEHALRVRAVRWRSAELVGLTT
jgi:glutamate racemase